MTLPTGFCPRHVFPIADGKCLVCESEAASSSVLDIQEGGTHYKEMKIEPVEYILANNLGFCEGNVVKYVTRYKSKNGVEDLKKARHYLDILIEQLSKQE